MELAALENMKRHFCRPRDISFAPRLSQTFPSFVGLCDSKEIKKAISHHSRTNEKTEERSRERERKDKAVFSGSKSSFVGCVQN